MALFFERRPPFEFRLKSRASRKKGKRSVIGKFIGEHELAAELKLTVSALRKWRQRGYGPAAKKIGKSVRYLRVDVEDFLANPPTGQK